MRALSLAVVVVIGSVGTVAGCAPVAGVVRPEHPLLGSDAGRATLTAAGSQIIFDDAVPDDDGSARQSRERIAKIAGEAVGKGQIVVDGERFRMDCSGVASGIYARAGFKLASTQGGADVRLLFDVVKHSGSLRRSHPLPGDFAFFDDTYDANGNGMRDDPLSHVAVVERIEDDGTVVLVHRVGTAVVRARMNLEEPHTRHDAKGHALNHYLRVAQGAEPAKTTAELFVAYGSLPLREPAVVATR